mmetsp:Transcript_34767/g.52091  ORF Transcript_34767/g.52091 Transcript_34767/m.52091 type:complete len:465 (-) Transcript_34767:1284-2678(-)|eukprot:scaffold3413_cov153-Skeletonema_dohrnii-CCMP3373.AAC.2
MFRRQQQSNNESSGEDDESSSSTNFSPLSPPISPPRSSNNMLVNIGRFLNVSAIGVLSIVSVLLFIQLQAVSLQVASEQKQIDELKKTIEQSTSDIQVEVQEQKDLTVVNIAGTFTLLSCIVTMFHMTSHLKKMNQPFVQRKIMAILWMSPVYAITSFLSLLLPSAEGYLGIVKDFYESYVIYQFLSFLIAVLGRGERQIVVDKLAAHADHLKHPYKWLRCLFHPPPEESDEAKANAVLLECQFLAMQFVFFRPLTAIVSFVLESMRDGDAGGFSSPDFIIMMIENVSVFLAFSGLLKFYHAVQDDLAWCQPFAKFLTIKGVVFMTFWQGLIISIIFHANTDDDKSDDDESNSGSSYSAKSIQHILICMEMLFFSAAHMCVFPAEEWEEGYQVKHGGGPTFAFNDFASDVNMIIDSGKRSRIARKERKNALDDAKQSPSFGTMDERNDASKDGGEISLVDSEVV